MPLAFALILVVGCGENESAKEKSAESAKAEEKLIAKMDILINSNRGIPEFLQQLHDSLKMVNGVIVIEDSLGIGISVLPPNSPWVVRCGAGITVILGSAVSGDENGVNNDVEIRLSMLPISNEQCKEIAPLIGKEIQSIVNLR
jgi:hypothetical protein